MTPKKILVARGKFSVAVSVGAILLAVAVGFAPRAEAGHVYGLDDCLEIAERNHPDLADAAASVASARARLELGAAGDRLQADGSVSASRSGSGAGERESYSIGATASLKIYDANRNKYSLDASRATLSATELEARRALLAVRSGVKEAYLALLLNHEIERQRADSVGAFERHLEQARGFYDAGRKPWYDVTKAEVDLGRAQMSLVEASSNTQNAHAALANAMGLDPSEDFEIARDGLDILSASDEAVSGAEALAVESRPDYAASALKIDAGRATLSSEARSNSPTVTLSGGYSGDADGSFDFERGWNTGLRMTAPILDGGAAKAREDASRAQLASLEASREKLRQDIMLGVSRARSDIIKARERMRIAGLTLVSAEANRRLAEGRYETGVGDALEVTDALLSHADAILASHQARYDLQIAIVNLERAVGSEFSRE